MILRHSNLAFAWLLIAAALFMRAAVPAGWMPEQGQDGSIIARVCNSGIQIEIPIKHGESLPEQSEHHAPCAFAGFAHGAPLASHADLALAIIAPQAITPAVLEQFRLSTADNLRPPGRAPPVMS